MHESSDIEKKLEELDRKIDDIHSKVRSLYRAQWWGRAWGLFYFFLVIGVAGGIFYYTKPYVDMILNASQKMNQIPIEALNNQIEMFSNFMPKK